MLSRELVDTLLLEQERMRTKDLASRLHLELPAEWTEKPMEGPDEPIHVEGVLELIGMLKAHYPDLECEIAPDTFEDGHRIHHLRARTGKTRVELTMA